MNAHPREWRCERLKELDRFISTQLYRERRRRGVRRTGADRWKARRREYLLAAGRLDQLEKEGLL